MPVAVQAQALSQYRVLAAYLRQDPSNDQEYLINRDEVIRMLALAFCDAFEPWESQTSSHEHCKQSLVQIMQSGAKAGTSIFAQQASYEWVWTPRHSCGRAEMGRHFVIVPAFVKVTDDTGVKLDHPFTMLAQTLQRY